MICSKLSVYFSDVWQMQSCDLQCHPEKTKFFMDCLSYFKFNKDYCARSKNPQCSQIQIWSILRDILFGDMNNGSALTINRGLVRYVG